jgi:predicted transposase YbfD/YdcC
MLSTAFKNLDDPRSDKNQKHLLEDIITISVCAFICGADHWTQVELFGKSKEEWFSTFLELPYGIPAHDTFSRFYAALDPKKFSKSFLLWMKGIELKTEGDVVAIDGKTLRRSYDKKSDKSAIHMVSAWSVQNKLVLGQVKTCEKSNEITAIPELLDLLDLKGCIVTMDAMGCQKNIAKAIIEKDADYALAIKGNQGRLYKDIKMFWNIHDRSGYSEIECDYYETQEQLHGRVEVRRYWHTDAINWMEQKADWSGIQSIGMVESERTVGGLTSLEHRYYITSMKPDAKRFGHAVRSQWAVENNLHWTLDIAFREDENRVRKANGAENMAILRHIVLNALKQEPSKHSIKSKRLKSGWDHSYLTKVFSYVA